MDALIITIMLSLLLGIKHATEVDHIAAMSLLVNEHSQPNVAIKLGALWGLGHGLVVFFVGVLFALLNLKASVISHLNFEPIVGCVLIAMALFWCVGDAFKNKPVFQVSGSLTGNRNAFSVGLLHGSAGSIAATLVLLGVGQSFVVKSAQLIMFGFGSVIGMALLCWLYAKHLDWCEKLFRDYGRLMRAVAVVFTLYIGIGLIVS